MTDIIDGGYSLASLAKGAIRAVIAVDPETTAAATGIDDTINMVPTAGSYALKTGWGDLGATTDPASYNRSAESEELFIEQERGAVDEEIVEVPRTVTLPLAHIDADMIKIFENAAAIESIVGAANVGAQKKVPLGTFESFDSYRIAFLGLRSKRAGLVTLPDTTTRPRMLMLTFHSASLTADESSIEMGKGSLWSAEVTFKAFPDADADTDEKHGAWFFEDAGTITAV